VHQTGNMADVDRNGVVGGRSIIESDFKPNDSTSGPPTFMASAFNHPAIASTVSSALLAYYDVLGGAGSSLHRDGGWELSHDLKPNNAADGNQIVISTGYTSLETYANSLVPEPPALGLMSMFGFVLLHRWRAGH
jgi:hypothetical protein